MLLATAGLGGMMGCAPGALAACATGLLRHTNGCFSRTLRRRISTPVAAVSRPASSQTVKDPVDDQEELQAAETTTGSMAAAMSPRELAALLLGPSNGAKPLTPEALAALSDTAVLRVPAWLLSNLTPTDVTAEGYKSTEAAAEGRRSDSAAGTGVQMDTPVRVQQQTVSGGPALPGLLRGAGTMRLFIYDQLQRGYTTAVDPIVPEQEAETGADGTVQQGHAKGGSQKAQKAQEQREWKLHIALATRLAQDFLALANRQSGWEYDRLVVSWNGNIGQDITIHSPASLLIELKVDWDKDMTRAVHQVQGNGSDNKKVSKELLLFLREQADDAGGLAVGGMLPAGHQQASSAAGGSGSKGRVRLAAWPVTATKAVEKLLVVEKPLAKMNAQELANHGVLSLEWDVDLDQDGYPKQVLANTNQLQSLLDFINQQEAARKLRSLTKKNLPMLLALAHPWLVKQIGQPILDGWMQDANKLRTDIDNHIKGQGLGRLQGGELKAKVKRYLSMSSTERLHELHGQQMWEAFCDVQAAILLMAEHGAGLSWRAVGGGKEGTPGYRLELFKGKDTLLHLKGAAACFVQRFVLGAYTVEPDYKEEVKKQIKEGLALLQFEQLQSKLGQVHTPIGVVQHACQEMVAPVVKEYLKQDKKVVLLEPSAGTGMFTGKLQQLASQYPGRVEVKAYELCQGQATIANALGHTTTGGWNSLVGPALERDTYTGGEPNTKLVVVGNPPYGRQGPAVDLGAKFLLANHAVQADDIIYIIALNCLLPDKNKEALRGGVEEVPVPYETRKLRGSVARLQTKPHGSSFDLQYYIPRQHELQSIVGCSNVEFSKVAKDPREASARVVMAPLLNLTALEGEYLQRGSSLMLHGLASGSSSDSSSDSNSDSSSDSGNGGSKKASKGSSISPGFNSALQGYFKEHASKKLAWPTVLLHMKRREEPATPGSKGFIEQLESRPIPLMQLPHSQQEEVEGLIPVHFPKGQGQVHITLEQLTPLEMFSHRSSLLATGGAEYGVPSKFGLWYSIHRTGKGPHSTNDLANRSLMGSSGKDGLAINTEEQLVDAAYQQAYREALTPPKSSAPRTTTQASSGSSSSDTSDHEVEGDQEWAVLTGFLGNHQPLMDPQDINSPFLRDVVLMFLAVGVNNHKWWAAAAEPFLPEEERKKRTRKQAAKKQLPSCIPSLLPKSVGGTGQIFTDDRLEQFRQHHQQLLSSSSGTVGNGSGSSSSGSSEQHPAGVLASSPDLMAKVPQLYQAFHKFWVYADGNVYTHQQLREEAREEIRAWLHTYLRRLVTTAVSDKQ